LEQVQAEIRRKYRIPPQVAEAIGLLRAMSVLRLDMLLAAGALNILGLALPLAMLQIYDRIIPNAAFGTLGILVLGLGTAIIMEAVLRQARSAIIAWEGARFEHRTTVELVERFLDAPVAEVESKAIGTHLDRLNSVEAIRDFYGQQASLLLVDAPFLIIYLGLMAYIGGAMVLAPVLLVALFGTLAWVTGHALHDVHGKRKVLDDRRYNFIVEVLSNIHTAKGLAMERVLARRYERLMASSAALSWRANYLGSVSESFGSGFAQLSTIAVGGFGAWLVIHGQMSTGALAAATMLAGRSVQPLLRSLALWTRYQAVRLSMERMRAIASMPRERNEDAATLGALESLTLENVFFRYVEEGPQLFAGLDLTIRRGETIGISGANGCGKSSLLWMLMGGLHPQEGRVTVNGAPIETINLKTLRQQVAFIPQRAVLFKGTVLDNLTNFDVDANLAQALDLATALGLDRYFAGVPDGYEMEIGAATNGGLPSGVVQRIAMVRALVGDPQLILFDEANAALDQAGDKLMRELLVRYQTRAAIVIVSFRPSLLAIADRQYHLRDGRLVDVTPQASSTKGAAA